MRQKSRNLWANTLPMKTLFVSLLVFVQLLAFIPSNAQLDIPQKSPKANISFRVGVTDVTITYCSPAVRGRGIWGKLVPYDKVWRAGANEATVIEISTDITISGTVLLKGKYGFFLIPSKEGTWTAVFNKVWDQWGAYKYDANKDALRIQVQAKPLTEVVEHLRYRITEKDIENGVIVMEWERRQVIIPFTTDAVNLSMENVQRALKAAKEEDKWWMNIEAAEFLLDHYCDVNLALEYTNASIQLKPTVRNYWVKAQLLAWKKDLSGAIAAADEATKLSTIKGNSEEKEYYTTIKEELEAHKLKWAKGNY